MQNLSILNRFGVTKKGNSNLEALRFTVVSNARERIAGLSHFRMECFRFAVLLYKKPYRTLKLMNS
jgi:hypothetical protein